jgi:hypothetical protein
MEKDMKTMPLLIADTQPELFVLYFCLVDCTEGGGSL